MLPVQPVSSPPQDRVVVGDAGSISTFDADCLGVRLLGSEGRELLVVTEDEEVTLEIRYRVKRDVDDPQVGFKLRNRQGIVLYETNTYCMRKKIGFAGRGSTIITTFTFLPHIFPDEYTITVGLGNRGFAEGSFEEILSYLHQTLAFSVVRPAGSPIWSGLMNLPPAIECRIVPMGD